MLQATGRWPKARDKQIFWSKNVFPKLIMIKLELFPQEY
jgi:hypothetical protein